MYDDREPTHDPTPEPGTIKQDGGMYIGDYSARCAFCGQPVEGNENWCWHVNEDDDHR